MHAKDDPRLMRFRDGFWFSRRILLREHAELESLRLKLSPSSVDEAVHAVATAWQIVDVVHRVRDLAEGVPGVNKRSGSRTRSFLDATAIAEKFRNYVQHLREEVSDPEVARFPVWGALSWVAPDGQTLHTTFLGVMRPGTEFHAGVYDAKECRWVSRVSLSVDRIHFNVDPIVAETTAFCDHILSVIDEVQPGLPPVGVLEPISWRWVLLPTDADADAAARAIPRVFPKPLIDEVNRRAEEGRKSHSDLVFEAQRAWAAAGHPDVEVPDSVHAVCSDLSEGAKLLVCGVYRALAWWLRQPAQPEAAQPQPPGDTSARAEGTS